VEPAKMVFSRNLFRKSLFRRYRVATRANEAGEAGDDTRARTLGNQALTAIHLRRAKHVKFKDLLFGESGSVHRAINFFDQVSRKYEGHLVSSLAEMYGFVTRHFVRTHRKEDSGSGSAASKKKDSSSDNLAEPLLWQLYFMFKLIAKDIKSASTVPAVDKRLWALQFAPVYAAAAPLAAAALAASTALSTGGPSSKRQRDFNLVPSILRILVQKMRHKRY